MRALAPIVLFAGCAERPSCEDIARDIAARTWECTGDLELGLARGRTLLRESACADEDQGAGVTSPGCADEIFAVPCARVDAMGDDPRAWLDEAPTCAAAFADGP